jgi:Tfp pilus assembly protein PilV
MLQSCFQRKPLGLEYGFTMMEVLLAILTLTLFLTGTLQLVAINTLYKIKNKQEAQAAFWIQEDLEEIRELASKTSETDEYIWETAKCNPSKQEESFAHALQKEIERRDASSDANERLPGSDTRQLLVSQVTEDEDTKKYKSNQNLKEYSLSRSFSISSDSSQKLNVLGIAYEVVDIDAQKNSNKDINQRNPVIAQQYAEVIPNKSFKCP